MLAAIRDIHYEAAYDSIEMMRRCPAGTLNRNKYGMQARTHLQIVIIAAKREGENEKFIDGAFLAATTCVSTQDYDEARTWLARAKECALKERDSIWENNRFKGGRAGNWAISTGNDGEALQMRDQYWRAFSEIYLSYGL